MTKLEFILELHNKLSALPQNELEERLNFYTEMIEDRMEEGLSEVDAVASVGSVDEIAGQILGEISPVPINLKAKRQWKVWEIVFLVLGSPIWLSLLIAAFSVVLSLYVCLWAVIITLWAVFVSIVGCAFGCIVGGICFTIFAINGNGYIVIVSIAGGLVCAGLAIFMFYGCKAITKGAVKLTGLLVKKCYSKKEVV